MTEPDDDDRAPDGRDYIYRGPEADDPSPPPSAPPPGAPPPAAPPPGAPPPGAPPPGAPPPPPPPQFAGSAGPPGPYAQPGDNKRRRWPWVVAGLVLFCGLPLGGCVALIGFGISEVNERTDEIGQVTDQLMAEAFARDEPALGALADGGVGCTGTAQLVDEVLVATAGGSDWDEDDIAFVERTSNSFIGNVTESESFVVGGRESESTAQVRGSIRLDETTRLLQITLLKPGSSWLVCTIEHT